MSAAQDKDREFDEAEKKGVEQDFSRFNLCGDGHLIIIVTSGCINGNL